LSIGAFPAAVIAGALDFASALRLVALRGDLMEQAYPHGYGLTAIMGLTRDRVEALLIAGETYIANLNADTQIVIAGTDEAMARVAQKALAIGATKAQRLAVSVPRTARCWTPRRPRWRKPSHRSRCSARAALT
jgi:malonate decarboxylase epsilon subunit